MFQASKKYYMGVVAVEETQGSATIPVGKPSDTCGRRKRRVFG